MAPISIAFGNFYNIIVARTTTSHAIASCGELSRERCHDKSLEFNAFPILSSTQKRTTASDAATRDIA